MSRISLKSSTVSSFLSKKMSEKKTKEKLPIIQKYFFVAPEKKESKNIAFKIENYMVVAKGRESILEKKFNYFHC